MGRSSRDDDRKRSRRHDDDDDDEERRKRRRRHDHDDEERSKDEDRRSSKKSRKKKHHHRREDGEDRKRRRHRDRDDSSSSSSSTSSRRHRKHHKKKSSSSSSKKHDKKSSSSSKKDKKSKKNKIQKPDKSRLVPLGDVVGKPPSKLIDSERDYFTYHQHFWVYLYREEGVAFNDLTSEESRASFERFAERYNRGDLEAAYFQEKHGFPREVLDECKTTKHSWSFQTNATEQRGLEALQEGVRKLTEYENPASKAPVSSVEPLATSSASTGNGGRHHQNEHHHHEHRRGKTPEERLEERRANKRFRDHVRTVQEELSGGKKDPGRERQLELRREKADRQHGAARDREDAKAGGVELSDKAIYGGDGSDFQNALAREKQRKANRQQKQTARIEELQNREKERQEEMLAKLGLSGVQPGQKITIAPRKDPPPM